MASVNRKMIFLTELSTYHTIFYDITVDKVKRKNNNL